MTVTVRPAKRRPCKPMRALAAESVSGYSTITLPKPEGGGAPGAAGRGMIRVTTWPYCRQNTILRHVVQISCSKLQYLSRLGFCKILSFIKQISIPPAFQVVKIAIHPQQLPQPCTFALCLCQICDRLSCVCLSIQQCILYYNQACYKGLLKSIGMWKDCSVKKLDYSSQNKAGSLASI